MSATAAEAGDRFNRLKQYWQQDRSNRRLSIDAAQAGLEAGDPQGSMEILDVALADSPGDVELMFLLGTAYLATSQFSTAAQQFEALCHAADAYPVVRYNLAYAHAQLRQFDMVIEALQPLSESALHEMPDAYRLLGSAHHHLGNLDHAVRCYRRYANASPASATAWGELAVAAFDNNDETTARIAAEQALKLDANSIGGHLSLGGLALERRHAPVAIDHFSAVIACDEHQGRAWSGLAFARMLKLDWPAAKVEFERAVREMPDHIGTWHGLAWTQLLEGNLDAAEQSLQNAMALDRNFGETHGSLAVIAALRGQAHEAERMARRASGLSPRSFSARYAKALLSSKRGASEKAQADISAIIDEAVPGGRAGLEQLVADLMSLESAQRREKSKKH